MHLAHPEGCMLQHSPHLLNGATSHSVGRKPGVLPTNRHQRRQQQQRHCL